MTEDRFDIEAAADGYHSFEVIRDADGWVKVICRYPAPELEAVLLEEAEASHGRLWVWLPPYWQDPEQHGIDFLRQCSQKIRRFTVQFRDLEALSVINTMRNLEALSLACPIAEVDFSRFAKLHTCELQQAVGLRDLTALRPLRHLRCLHLNSILRLESLDGIDALPLEELELVNLSRVRSVAPLARMSTLQTLWVQRCRAVRDLERIGEITSLQKLYVERCRAFEWVQGLAQLRELAIQNTQRGAEAVSLAPLRHLTQLRELKLVQIKHTTDIEALGALISLELFSIHHGPELSSLEFLRGLTRLRHVGIVGARITDGDLSVLLDLPELQCVEVQPHNKHYSHRDDHLQAILDSRASDGADA